MMDWTPARAVQSICRIGRKVEPVAIIDIETRGLDDRIMMAVKEKGKAVKFFLDLDGTDE